MHSIRKMQLAAGAALLAGASAAVAHEEGGWASIHWHSTDYLGLAVVGALCVAALWLARRQRRAANKQ